VGVDGFEIRHAFGDDSGPVLVLRNSKSSLTTFSVAFATESPLFSTSGLLEAAYLLCEILPHHV
jgi:hypothetical protein